MIWGQDGYHWLVIFITWLWVEGRQHSEATFTTTCCLV
jgi:hypothetical protein